MIIAMIRDAELRHICIASLRDCEGFGAFGVISAVTIGRGRICDSVPLA
jgi:hypothetical protein